MSAPAMLRTTSSPSSHPSRRKTESHEKGRLVFNLYRGEYVLAEVWNSNSKAGALLNNKTRPEMEIAAADPNRQTTVLYA